LAGFGSGKEVGGRGRKPTLMLRLMPEKAPADHARSDFCAAEIFSLLAIRMSAEKVLGRFSLQICLMA